MESKRYGTPLGNAMKAITIGTFARVLEIGSEFFNEWVYVEAIDRNIATCTIRRPCENMVTIRVMTMHLRYF